MAIFGYPNREAIGGIFFTKNFISNNKEEYKESLKVALADHSLWLCLINFFDIFIILRSL